MLPEGAVPCGMGNYFCQVSSGVTIFLTHVRILCNGSYANAGDAQES